MLNFKKIFPFKFLPISEYFPGKAENTRKFLPTQPPPNRSFFKSLGKAQPGPKNGTLFWSRKKEVPRIPKGLLKIFLK